MYKLLKAIEIGISTKFKTPKGHSRDFIHRKILLIIYHQLNKMPPISRRKPTAFIFILPSSSSLIKPVRVLHFHCLA
ncbi:hypothetical protein HanRHA438_Chr05g0232441 [Helianthus annuus]|uniref:Uncharacterized protein n=1 Tax=Helianthus annuus TaxID=4232 RepID=A0A251US55_HELAN|nr:hypothetical protein HanHA89_Chr05g0197541 [Helianthus annuus]KAJ0919684.1 hypothetical protein HanRHA438_Chr05g0232441 [Helianthus annuus]